MTGKEMRQHLERLGWSLADLSRATGTHRNTVSRWARARRVPGPVAAFLELATTIGEAARRWKKPR